MLGESHMSHKNPTPLNPKGFRDRHFGLSELAELNNPLDI